MDGERAARDRTRDHPRQIEHAYALERTIAGGPRLWRRLADLFNHDRRQRGERLGVRQTGPFCVRSHQRNDAAAGIGRGLECLAVPLHQRGLHLVALRLTTQDFANGIAVMREVGVQPDESLIAGFVNPGDRIPGGRRRLAVDAQIALAAAFDDGVAHVDRDILVLSAAQFPNLRGSQACRGNAYLRRGGNAKGRRQLRFFPRQRDGVERRRLAADRGPDVRKDFSGALHDRHSSLRVQSSALPWKELQWLPSIH